jgi:hypothetical protein
MPRVDRRRVKHTRIYGGNLIRLSIADTYSEPHLIFLFICLKCLINKNKSNVES